MAPPLLPLTAALLASPLVIVRLAMLTLLAMTSKTRAAWLPLTVNRLAPGPLMVTLSVMRNSPLVRVMVPRTLVANAMVSGPGLLLAWPTAQRREPGLVLSRRSVTVKVLGRVRSSRASSRRTVRRGKAIALRPGHRCDALACRSRDFNQPKTEKRNMIQLHYCGP